MFIAIFINQGFIVCCNGIVKGVYRDLAKEFKGFEIQDYGENLIIQGLVDLYIHVP